MGFLNARTLATIIGLLLATPVLTAPSGDGTVEGFYPVENIVPQEYIDQVRAYHEVKARTEWQRNKRALNTLQKRVPDDALCDRGDEWVARNCLSDEGPQLWEDECQTPEGDLYERDGQCPPDTVCMPDEIVRIINGEEVEESDIICQPSTPPRTDIVTTKNKQYGYRPIGIYGGTQIVEIPILADYSSASVSAELLSSDRSFAIQPVGTLTANYRGRVLNLCKQDRNNVRQNSRQCLPTGDPKQLSNGGTVDFTFGTSLGQEGFLFYSFA